MTTDEFLRWIHCTIWMDERVVTSEKCWIGVENLTRLNALEGEMWKRNQKVVTDEKSWKTWKRNQNSVMNEELVQNSVMNEELVQNSLMNEELVQNSVMNEELVQNG